jgi:LacI family transcriptional regulator
LLRRLEDPFAPRRIVRLPAEIEHRESCGCHAEPRRAPGPGPASPPAGAPTRKPVAAKVR